MRDVVAAQFMEDRLIKIKKPAGNQGGFFERLKSFFSRLSAWLMGVAPPRRPKRISLQSKPRMALPPASPSDDGKSVIRIRTLPTGDNITVRDTPRPPTPTRIRPRQSERRKERRINLDDEIRICKACGEEFADGDLKSRCLNDSLHFVHRRCTEIMKHKCPYCGGRLV